LGIYNLLTEIQNELKVPKTKFNSFGKYNYRNCEDILEAVKPLLKKHSASLYISDTVDHIGERYYVKSTAVLEHNGEKISCFGLAREDNERKGMDLSQITGSCSSYARKYALNGMFLIDDTKDADSDETIHSAIEWARKNKKSANELRELMIHRGINLSIENVKLIEKELSNA
jgi:hypothetical protein